MIVPVRTNAPAARIKRLDWAAPDLSETSTSSSALDSSTASGHSVGAPRDVYCVVPAGRTAAPLRPAGRHGLDERTR